MILFIHLQQQHVPNNPHKFYSNRPPRLFTTARNRRRHDAIEVRIVFIDNFRHSARRCFFSESTLRCWTALTLASKMPHMEKSSGFKSGLEGGDSDDEMKSEFQRGTSRGTTFAFVGWGRVVLGSPFALSENPLDRNAFRQPSRIAFQ